MTDIRLLHGDCLQIMKTFADGEFDAVITDPPYGIDYQSAWRIDKSQWKPKIANDKEPFTTWIKESYRVIKFGGSSHCFCRWDCQEVFRNAIETAGFVVKSQVIWDRIVHGMGDLNGAYAPQHDIIWFSTKGRFTFSGKRPQSVIRIMRVAPTKLLHPNEKPIGLLEHIIRSTTNPGDHILDPFGGSGTTAVACVKTERRCTSIEIDEGYHDISVKRVAGAQMQPGLL